MFRFTGVTNSMWVLLAALLLTTWSNVVGKLIVGMHRERLRIANGVNARLKEFPYLVAVSVETYQECAGTLFSSSAAVTACHCLIRDPTHLGDYKFPQKLQDPAVVEVAAGTTHSDIIYYTDGEAIYAKALKVHPKCNLTLTSLLYDYGIIILQKSFTLVKGHIEVFPHERGTKEQITMAIMKPDGLHCEAMGWGSANDTTSPPGVLMKIEVKLMTLDWCAKTISDMSKDDKNETIIFARDLQVCTVGEGKNQTSCSGDNGGPLVCGMKNKLFLGIYTGNPSGTCGDTSSPDVYARADSAWDWFMEEIPPEPVTNPTTNTSSDQTAGPTDTSPSADTEPTHHPTAPSKTTKDPQSKSRRNESFPSAILLLFLLIHIE